LTDTEKLIPLFIKSFVLIESVIIKPLNISLMKGTL
jgi:hypothetical protein